jgi:hypothetical protein
LRDPVCPGITQLTVSDPAAGWDKSALKSRASQLRRPFASFNIAIRADGNVSTRGRLSSIEHDELPTPGPHPG